MMNLLRFVVACAIIVYASSAHADKKPLRFGYFPFHVSYQDHAGEAQGALIDLARAIARRGGRKLIFVPLSQQRLRTALRDGDVDVAIVTDRYREFAQGAVVFSADAVMRLDMVAVTTAETPKIAEQSDLFDRRVIVRNGYDYFGWRDFIDQSRTRIASVLEVNNTDAGVVHLMRDRGDVLLEYRGNIADSRHADAIEGFTLTSLVAVPLFIAVSTENLEAEAALADLERGFALYRAEDAVR